MPIDCDLQIKRGGIVGIYLHPWREITSLLTLTPIQKAQAIQPGLFFCPSCSFNGALFVLGNGRF